MEEYQKMLSRIHDTVTKQSRLIEMQKEIIDELYRLLLMHVSASDLEPLNKKITKAAETMKEVEG